MKRASDHGCRLFCLLMQEHKKGKTFGQTVEILITFHCFTALVPLLHNQQSFKSAAGGREGRSGWEKGLLGMLLHWWSCFVCRLCVCSNREEISEADRKEVEERVKRRWSSEYSGSPFAWAPCPATAGDRSGAARSSRGCWLPSVSWQSRTRC